MLVCTADHVTCAQMLLDISPLWPPRQDTLLAALVQSISQPVVLLWGHNAEQAEHWKGASFMVGNASIQ